MNERVKELVKLSMKPRWITNAYNGAHEYSGDELDVQKFAELIVRECQFAIVSRTDLPKHERKLYNNVLKDYFGVE